MKTWQVTILIYSVNSSDPETATFVLHKATKIKCCFFLQESPAVARQAYYYRPVVPVALLTFKVIQGQ